MGGVHEEQHYSIAVAILRQLKELDNPEVSDQRLRKIIETGDFVAGDVERAEILFQAVAVALFSDLRPLASGTS